MRIVAGKAVFEQVRPSLFPGGLSASGYGTRSAPLPSNAIRRGAGSIAPFIYSPCTGRFGGQRPGEGLASGPPGMGETAERIWNSRQRRTRRNSGNSHTGCTLNENGKLRRARDCPPYHPKKARARVTSWYCVLSSIGRRRNEAPCGMIRESTARAEPLPPTKRKLAPEIPGICRVRFSAVGRVAPPTAVDFSGNADSAGITRSRG